MRAKTERKAVQETERKRFALHRSVKRIVESDAFPPAVRKAALTEAITYTTSYFAGEGKLAICLICGRWFLTERPQTKTCSEPCRRRLDAFVMDIKRGRRRQITQKLRKTPFYLFLYLAIRQGILPAKLLNREKPEDLPPPIPATLDLFEAVGLTPMQASNEVADIAERLLTQGKKEVNEA